MASIISIRDIYGPHAEGGPITRIRTAARKLSAPRERTLTEFEQIRRDEDDYESERHFEQECGD